MGTTKAMGEYERDSNKYNYSNTSPIRVARAAHTTQRFATIG